MTDPFQSPLVFDTSAVYCFGHRGRLESVLAEYSTRYTLVIPPDAEKEVLSEEEYAYPDLLAQYFQRKASTVDVLDLDWLAEVSRRLDPGEIGVLLVAYETNGTAIIDEKKARIEARRQGISCVGTMRLLMHAVERGWIGDEDACASVGRMRRAGFRCPAIDAYRRFSVCYCLQKTGYFPSFRRWWSTGARCVASFAALFLIDRRRTNCSRQCRASAAASATSAQRCVRRASSSSAVSVNPKPPSIAV